MARSRTIQTGWTHPQTEDDFRVTLRYTPGHDGSAWEPPEGPEIEILKVVEDRPGGIERPDLIDIVDAELDGRWGDEVADDICDRERDAYTDTREDRYLDARAAIWDTVSLSAGGRRV